MTRSAARPGAFPPLYDPRLEHDACGVGFVANVSGARSHAILQLAITSVINLTHRGAVDADAKSGDGAGVLTQIPHPLFARELARRELHVADLDYLAVGMCFLPRRAAEQAHGRRLVEEATGRRGLEFLGWREVPVDASVLGDKAQTTQPCIVQALIA